MLYSCRRGVWMAAWVSVMGASVPCAFADTPAPPAHTGQAAIVRSDRAAAPAAPSQDGNANAVDARGNMRPRGRLRPAALVRPRVDTSVATFPGFRLLPDGKSQLYVELSRPCSVKERREGGTLVYVLRGTRVVAKNNKNALITTHFATPMDRARLVPAGEDLEVVIDLRTEVMAAYAVVSSDAGTARLEVTFPAGSFPPNAPRRFEPAAGRDKSEAPAGAQDTTDPAPANGSAVGPANDGRVPPAKANEQGAPPAPHP